MSRYFNKRSTIENHKIQTGIGEGIAIPHAKAAGVSLPAIAFGMESRCKIIKVCICNYRLIFYHRQRQEGVLNTFSLASANLLGFKLHENVREKLLHVIT